MELLFVGVIIGIVVMKVWHGVKYYKYFRKDTNKLDGGGGTWERSLHAY